MQHQYTIKGMSCSGCVQTVQSALLKVEGIQEVKVDLEKGTADVSMEHAVPINALQQALSKAGQYLIMT